MRKRCYVVISLFFVSACSLFCLLSFSRGVISLSDKKDELSSLNLPVILSYNGFKAFLDNNDFSGEKELIASIRKALESSNLLDHVSRLSIPCDPDKLRVSITLFQEDVESLRWISKRGSLLDAVNNSISTLRNNKRFKEFEVNDPGKCRIMLEIIIAEQPLRIKKLTSTAFSKYRFEPGMTGFEFTYERKPYVYMPTDAAVYSHLTLNDVFNHLAKKTGISKKTNSISKRIGLLQKEASDWSILYGVAFISCDNNILPLYRGYPAPVEYSESEMITEVQQAVGWISENLSDDGKFLYYYDGIRDSIIDHDHPSRDIDDNYYNMLRHCGGIITLLRMNEYSPRQEYIDAADKALGYLVKELREQKINSEKAYYVECNKKGKLGGSGVGLVSMIRYYQATKDPKYNDYIYGLVRHLLSRIDENGEMIGYYIHPLFRNGKPIIDPTEEEKKALFSFYYPGEALLGLALFIKEMPVEMEYKNKIKGDITRALDFLVYERPIKYKEMFQVLPSDGWLMQAIEELATDKDFQKDAYINFVFNDAQKLVDHMYTEENSPYYDYPGAFYYQYGDHAYPDGARAEGLIAAYYLAKYLNKNELAESILHDCQQVARSLMFIYNSRQSTYMYKDPQKGLGAFRFKLTRQWMRVDTTQHVVCFFVRLLNSSGKCQVKQ